MRHEQEYDRDHRHPEDYRHMPRRHPEHHHDFGSRWGDPEPQFGPGGRDRGMYHGERRSDRDDFYHHDWRPFEQPANRHFRDRGYEPEYHHEPPVWRQQDVHFSSENQHANDRWRSYRHEPPPHPHERPRHTAEHFYREDRRRQ